MDMLERLIMMNEHDSRGSGTIKPGWWWARNTLLWLGIFEVSVVLIAHLAGRGDVVSDLCAVVGSAVCFGLVKWCNGDKTKSN